MKKFRISSLLFILVVLSIRAYADMPTAKFLLEAQGPRATALGGAVVSDSMDYSAWYWNPAGAAFVKVPELGLNGQKITQNISSSYLSFACPVDSYVLGLQVISQNSTVASYDGSGQALGSVNNQNLLYSLGFAFNIIDSVAIGLTLGNVNMKLADSKTNDALNMNAGVMYVTGGFSAGVDAANIGDQLTFGPASGKENQPALVRYGISYGFFEERSLVISIAKQDVSGSKELSSYGGGIEYTLGNFLALRAGALNQNELMRICSGLGIKYKHIGLDFSYTFGPQDLQGLDIAQIGLWYKFGQKK